MVRPKLCRQLHFKPKSHYFKPQGVPMHNLEEVVLTKEEMETVKLKDYDKLEQTEAAEKMKTSQSTYHGFWFLPEPKLPRRLSKAKR